MIRSPIHKVLLTFRKFNVRYLLMGGQACIFYGAAEFSRDIDFSIAIDTDNIEAIKRALDELRAERVFVPEMKPEFLMRGHACHFRCHAEGVEGLRIDLMNCMRNCDSFEKLWQRRSIVEIPEVDRVNLLSLSDLIKAKKTQREKDWPMICRLIEVDIVQNNVQPDDATVFFWLTECRTPEILIDLADKYPAVLEKAKKNRPLLKSIEHASPQQVTKLLYDEQQQEKQLDREYWFPLKKELEKWRHKSR